MARCVEANAFELLELHHRNKRRIDVACWVLKNSCGCAMFGIEIFITKENIKRFGP